MWVGALPESIWTCGAIILTPRMPRYSFRVPVYQAGDVWHRMQVRIDEVNESIGIIRNAMAG